MKEVARPDSEQNHVTQVNIQHARDPFWPVACSTLHLQGCLSDAHKISFAASNAAGRCVTAARLHLPAATACLVDGQPNNTNAATNRPHQAKKVPLCLKQTVTDILTAAVKCVLLVNIVSLHVQDLVYFLLTFWQSLLLKMLIAMIGIDIVYTVMNRVVYQV